MVLFFFGLITLITDKYWANADEELWVTDADHYELEMTANEQELIDRVILRYEWDEAYQGSTTVTMSAHVN
jgi:hypothetical protein